MHTTPGEDIRERLAPVLVPIGRTVLGICLGVVLSMIGIGIAWGLFIFFGGQSSSIWLASLYVGAGLGAGTGCFFAWLRIDGDETLTLLLTAAIIAGAGILGAWGGFEYGSTQEVECCAMPTKSPIYYTALGSVVLANAAAIGVAAFRALHTRQRQTQIQNKVH